VGEKGKDGGRGRGGLVYGMDVFTIEDGVAKEGVRCKGAQATTLGSP
jgi:hypothetical protein